jgi:two-component system, OmpR family, response regulator
MASTTDPTPPRNSDTERTDERPRVLVVDDDPKVREVAVWALEDEGFAVEEAANRRQAAERARQRPPALVVLDMSLPPHDGDTVAADLRAVCGPQLPILVITADGKASEKARRVGAYAALHKPFDVNQLVRLVRERLAA